ncbi:MAG: CoA transferase [Hyphomicrobiales bacterium]|nr:CoA transferase [Hyphomicrobiales bacterium]OQW82450.1 MAG: hypothetical protein BVN31_08115 [Proteobacteria bacterium ST_bin15]
MTPPPTGPLKGIRIVDLTAVVLGAFAAQMLGELGADIVKVEAPGGPAVGGDIMRWAGDTPAGPASGLAPMFMMLNRNKRSVALDLKTSAGHAALAALLKTADVFLANRPASALAKLNLSYEQVKAIKPDIVYVNAPGYGSAGPYGDFPAYDELIQAGSGGADMMPRTYEGTPPRYLPTLIADKTVGMYLAQAALAGIVHKLRTGEGQSIEVPMLECMTYFNLSENLYGHSFDPPLGKYGYVRIHTPHRRPYRTSDGWIAISPYSDRNWRDFFALVGREDEFLADERFATYQKRIKNIDVLYAMMEEMTVQKTSQAWFEACAAKNIPCMHVRRFEELTDDPHLKTVGLFEKRRHSVAGGIQDVRHPVTYSRTPAAWHREQPVLGAHTREVLSEAGLTADDIDRLAADGAFG